MFRLWLVCDCNLGGSSHGWAQGWCVERVNGRETVWFLLIRQQSHHLSEVQSPNIITLGIRALTYGFGGLGTDIHFMASALGKILW